MVRMIRILCSRGLTRAELESCKRQVCIARSCWYQGRAGGGVMTYRQGDRCSANSVRC